ncbi:hypothetical protein HPHPP11B_1358 [Helicobacter pylori Hp P-11b]|uniref:Uncharacterized protein n=3 Tax=Helicobacter pylori TaxID=210 RepID=D7FCH0_HELP3|nr:hypothetical protein HPHPH27_0821 [Helicobacter pylori Hp H-27]EJB58441.1 hypothetical protein HPHPH36_1370 [Helicobacter pylori Hp H-36]EJC06218.1 hypothetical protein HPHPP15_1405 [Helicobacter pylori Hp P-15]EJC08864.1 hypothetical protein HPHPP11_0703 [Helicobacter pylori Hp P-11]EJC16031.1 hypothetical protein HPHPP74_0836 [Helicobacter pylori Hp P-74]EJC27262.1 hypothetical protein HPHPP11B_1358 [Helicobacter pylori Hp P-11b]CBI65877.1 hypothetical protein predicted by Glimmer/Critic
MSFFVVFIKNDHFLAEFLKKRVFYSLLLIETTQSRILRQFKIK